MQVENIKDFQIALARLKSPERGEHAMMARDSEQETDMNGEERTGNNAEAEPPQPDTAPSPAATLPSAGGTLPVAITTSTSATTTTTSTSNGRQILLLQWWDGPNGFPLYHQQPLLHQQQVQQRYNKVHQYFQNSEQVCAHVVQKIARNPMPISLIADKYLVLDQMEGSSLHSCVNVRTEESYVCKVVEKDKSSSLLSAHYLLDSEERINRLHEVIVGDKFLYLIFMPSHGDLHSYVRQKKRLREDEAKLLFKQIVLTVQSCHQHGIVLRDLKLRKFVFADSQRTKIRLETLDDAVLLEDSMSDELQDKRGCPAYVSPEILKSHTTYSGKAADIWSLGIILYTMLVGRYPFNDMHHSSLFAKITRGYYTIPEHLSLKARCLIRSLLRRDPQERLPTSDILIHPWFTHRQKYDPSLPPNNMDHVVPSVSSKIGEEADE